MVHPLVELLPHLSESQQEKVLPQVLQVTSSMEDAEAQVRVLGRLAPYLPEGLLREVSAKAPEIGDEWNWEQAEALQMLASRLAELGQAQEALETTRRIQVRFLREQALRGVTPRLSAPLLPEALKMTPEIEDAWEQEAMLQALASQLMQLGDTDEAFSVMGGIGNDHDRTQMLAALALQLGEQGCPQEALITARHIDDWLERAYTLARLVSHLPEPVRGKVVKEVLEIVPSISGPPEYDIDDQLAQWFVIMEMVPHLSEPVEGDMAEEMLEAAPKILAMLWSEIEDESEFGESLGHWIPDLPQPLRGVVAQEALAAAREINDGLGRVEALAELIPHLPVPLKSSVLGEALDTAWQLDETWRIAKAFSAVASHLPEAPLREVLAMAQQLDGFEQGQLMRTLVPRLAELGCSEEAMAFVQEIDEWARAEVLAELAPHLSVGLLQQALVLAQEIPLELSSRFSVGGSSRTAALTRLVTELAQTGQPQYALEIAQEMADKDDRVAAMATLAPLLPEPLAREVLTTAQGMDNERDRAGAVSGLAPRLAELGYAQEALETVLQIESESSRKDALLRVVPYLLKLPRVTLCSLWRETLRNLARRTRSDLLSDLCGLAPIIAKLGGKEAIIGTFQAIQDVGSWWP